MVQVWKSNSYGRERVSMPTVNQPDNFRMLTRNLRIESKRLNRDLADKSSEIARMAMALKEEVLKSLIPSGHDPAKYIQEHGIHLESYPGDEREYLMMDGVTLGSFGLEVAQPNSGGVLMRYTWKQRA